MAERRMFASCPGCCNCAPSNYNDPTCNGDGAPIEFVPAEQADMLAEALRFIERAEHTVGRDAVEIARAALGAYEAEDNTSRETLYVYGHLKNAEIDARLARKHGRTNVTITGEPGAWKLRADRDLSHEKTGWRPGP